MRAEFCPKLNDVIAVPKKKRWAAWDCPAYNGAKDFCPCGCMLPVDPRVPRCVKRARQAAANTEDSSFCGWSDPLEGVAAPKWVCAATAEVGKSRGGQLLPVASAGQSPCPKQVSYAKLDDAKIACIAMERCGGITQYASPCNPTSRI